MISGIILLVIGALLHYWVGGRRFKRRNQSGLEQFGSYGKALATQGLERVLLILSRLLLLIGLAVVVSAWFVHRM